MTEKIDWYREVLELEPNSKVFLPLARMLVQENALPEAIDALEKGLARHPEFLEARLFLIELLYKSGQKQKCDAQVQILSRMFSTYAGFWQAWAACLSGSGEDADAASALRFLAVQFLKGPTSLADVINSGVAAIIGDASNTATAENPATARSETVADSAQNHANGSEERAAEEASEPVVPEETLAETPREDASPAEEGALEEETPAADIQPEPETAPEEISRGEAEKIEAASEEPLEETDESAEIADIPETGVQEEADDATEALVRTEAPVEVAEGLAKAAELARDLTPAEDGEETGEDSEEPESFSLRTKSMAEVLAAQGDIRGALDIYLELQAAAEGDEADEIGERVAELKALAAEPKQEGTEAAKTANNKDKLINILETLARRVEARASAPL